MKSAKLIIPTEPGDPISSVFVDSSVVVAGSLLGRVWIYDPSRNTRRMLAGFSDDAIRGLYVQDGTVFATVGDIHCRQIREKDPFDQLEMKFNRRSTASGFKYVFQKFNQVTILYPGMTTFVDVANNSQTMCPFKLQQATVVSICPVDCYQYLLLFTEFPVSDSSPPPSRRFKLVDISTGQLKHEFSDSSITHARFINERLLVFVTKGNIVVFDLIARKEVSRYRNFHRSEIVALDCSICLGEAGTPPVVVSAGKDGSIIAWNYDTGQIIARGSLPQPCFSLGFAYVVQGYLSGNHASGHITSGFVHVAMSDDHGVHFLRLDISSLTAKTPEDRSSDPSILQV